MLIKSKTVKNLAVLFVQKVALVFEVLKTDIVIKL